MRRRSIYVTVLLLCVALVLGATGCGELQKAREIVRGANPNVAKGNELVGRSGQDWDKIMKLPDTPAGYKQGITVSKDGKAASVSAKDEYQKVIDAIDKAAKLNVSADYRKYLQMKKTALEARLQVLTLMAERYQQITNLYAAAIARNIKKWKLAKARIGAISAKIKKAPDSDKLDATANAFGKKKGF